MIITRTGSVLFVDVPRNAGTILSRVLFELGASNLKSLQNAAGESIPVHRHSPARDAQRMMDAELYNRMFKFGMVRNPWDRLAAIFLHVAKGPFSDAKNATAEEFKHWLMTADVESNVYGRSVTELPQSWWLCDEEDQLIVDYVGKFENINNELQQLGGTLGVKVPAKSFNTPANTTPWWMYYDAESYQCVAERFASDIRLFDYPVSLQELQQAQQKYSEASERAKLAV